MKTAGAAIVVLASSCIISPVMHFGAGKSAKEAQHDTLTKMTPPALVVDNEWPGEVRVATIRVWADDDFRSSRAACVLRQRDASTSGWRVSFEG